MYYPHSYLHPFDAKRSLFFLLCFTRVVCFLPTCLKINTVRQSLSAMLEILSLLVLTLYPPAHIHTPIPGTLAAHQTSELEPETTARQLGRKLLLWSTLSSVCTIPLLLPTFPPSFPTISLAQRLWMFTLWIWCWSFCVCVCVFFIFFVAFYEICLVCSAFKYAFGYRLLWKCLKIGWMEQRRVAAAVASAGALLHSFRF